jgi:benzoyl-CoA-dihydrodiol lyase
MAQAAVQPVTTPLVSFDTHPSRYRHWKLSFDGPVATLAMDVDEGSGLQPGYALKLNSYDFGVDIELHDALQRIRFEHPEVRSVVLTSAKERIFCSGANIFMLGLSSHAWKVNFCKFTNETRNGMEDSSRHSGLRFLAACNGTTAGGGYELALACDEILLIDDRSSAVSLPEVPLLGVLPGTGGLTRLTDKRRVRRDHADIFCTLAEGVRAPRAREWRLIDDHVKPQEFAGRVRHRALELAASSDRPADARGVELPPLERVIDASGYRYRHVDVQLNPRARTANLTVSAPSAPEPGDLQAILVRGAAWWPLAMARELDDAILRLRSNHLEIGTWILRRTLGRLETSSRTLFALVQTKSCFAGTLLELALAADRTYMLHATEDSASPRIVVSTMNFGRYLTAAQTDRLTARFYGDQSSLERIQAAVGQELGAADALALGLVTAAPDELDWAEEIRLAIEERTSLSPDALTGMEASLRFGGAETMETRIFGRLSAWQNWIFVRPNAVGETGALKVFGSGTKANFDWERV